MAERGTHGELLAKGGLYAGLWNRQREAAEAEEKIAGLRARRPGPVPGSRLRFARCACCPDPEAAEPGGGSRPDGRDPRAPAVPVLSPALGPQRAAGAAGGPRRPAPRSAVRPRGGRIRLWPWPHLPALHRPGGAARRAGSCSLRPGSPSGRTRPGLPPRRPMLAGWSGMSAVKVAARRGRASALRRAITADIAEGDVQEGAGASWRRSASRRRRRCPPLCRPGRQWPHRRLRGDAAHRPRAPARRGVFLRRSGGCGAGAGHPLRRADQRELFGPDPAAGGRPAAWPSPATRGRRTVPSWTAPGARWAVAVRSLDGRLRPSTASHPSSGAPGPRPRRGWCVPHMVGEDQDEPSVEVGALGLGQAADAPR